MKPYNPLLLNGRGRVLEGFGSRGNSAVAAELPTAAAGTLGSGVGASSFSYAAFAKTFPFANNIIIATVKTSAADLMAQCVLEGKPLGEVDWKRNLVFCLFGAAYLGGFQYLYQVNVFKRVFSNAEAFTKQTLVAKLKDGPGLLSLAAQCVTDLTILVFIYLPTFYVFKESVFSDSWSFSDWVSAGVGKYQNNFSSDAAATIKVWGPVDVVCFSAPMYLRLPLRHVISFFWTAYLSFIRGSK
jgi:hypothetical protein